LVLEARKGTLERGLAERPLVRQLAGNRPVLLRYVGHVVVVGQQARRLIILIGHRAAEAAGYVELEAALFLGAVGAHVVAADLEIGHRAVDTPAAVQRVIPAIPDIGLVFAIVEIVGREIGIIF